MAVAVGDSLPAGRLAWDILRGERTGDRVGATWDEGANIAVKLCRNGGEVV